MRKDKVISISICISIFFMVCLSLLSLQNNDIRIPQKNSKVIIDVRDKLVNL